MSTCTECNPCNSQEDWELIRATVIPSDECVTDCCSPCWWTSWGATWWLNIQWEWCVTIDTSECWVVKVKVPCPEPTQVVAWKNVTVSWPTEWDEWYDIKWKVNADNNKVSVCWSDKEWYLDDKIVAGNWIDIDTDCSSWKMKISIDENILPKCPDIPSVTIDDSQCSLVKASASWHHIILKDNNSSNSAFAKIRLIQDVTYNDLQPGKTKKYDVTWPGLFEVVPARNKNMIHNVRFDEWLWVLVIQQKWLYSISFNWTVEIGSWVHAFRAQLYSTAEVAWWWVTTIIESRYSWPVWQHPFMNSRYPQWYNSSHEIVTEDDTYNIPELKIDAPIWNTHTDLNYDSSTTEMWGSASLGSYVSRFPVWWNTIAVLNKWDAISLGIKISAEVYYRWLLSQYDTDKWPELSILKYWSRRSWGLQDIWREPGLNISVALISPLTDYF